MINCWNLLNWAYVLALGQVLEAQADLAVASPGLRFCFLEFGGRFEVMLSSGCVFGLVLLRRI